MDGDLICNFKKCRKSLSKYAWVTSCSHIFCEEDGSREFNKAYTCPACESSLSGTFDIIRIDLQPSDQYKSMVLAGLKPEIIMEICTRALSFWTYQSHQERIYQEYVATKVKEKASQLEKYYEEIVSRIQSELNYLQGYQSSYHKIPSTTDFPFMNAALKLQHTNSKKEMETSKKKYGELTDKLMEKTRQCQKLQSMYDALRRKLITPINYEKDAYEKFDNNNHGIRREQFNLPLSSADSILRKPHTSPDPINTNFSENFVLEPNHTPVAGSFHNGVKQRGKMPK